MITYYFLDTEAGPSAVTWSDAQPLANTVPPRGPLLPILGL